MFAPHEPNSKLSYFEKRASWEDVAAKGRAIVASDGVEVIRDDAQEVEAWVMSGQLEGERNDLGGLIDITDGGPYDVILSKKSWENKTNVGGWIQGWMCDCFIPGTLVTMADGTFKKIEDVEVGDIVLGGDGLPHAVTHTMSRMEHDHVRAIKPYGTKLTIRCTDNHPWWAIEKIRCNRCESHDIHPYRCKDTHSGKTPPRWMDAKDLDAGMYIQLKKPEWDCHEIVFDMADYCYIYEEAEDGYIQPVVEIRRTAHGKPQRFTQKAGNQIKRFVPFDGRVAYVMGLYLGDGCLHHSESIVWSFGSGEEHLADAVIAILGECFGVNVTKNVHTDDGGKHNMWIVTAHSAPLTKLFKDMLGEYSHEKRISYDLMHADPNALIGFVEGWDDSDACISVNRNMVGQMQLIMLMNGIDTVVRIRKGEGRNNSVLVPCQNTRELYELYWRRNAKQGTARRVTDGSGEWVRIESVVDEPYSGLVYNLEVEGDHTYLVNGFKVHNCVWGSYFSGYPDGMKWHGRFCSHAYALMLYKNMRARKDFMGASVIDRENFIKDACNGFDVGEVTDRGSYQIVRSGDKVAIRIKKANEEFRISIDGEGCSGFAYIEQDEDLDLFCDISVDCWGDNGEESVDTYTTIYNPTNMYDVAIELAQEIEAEYGGELGIDLDALEIELSAVLDTKTAKAAKKGNKMYRWYRYAQEETTDPVEREFEALMKRLRDAQGQDALVEELQDVCSDPKDYALLCAGFGDGEFAESMFNTSDTTLQVKLLYPTQSEIGLGNSLDFMLTGRSNVDMYFNSPVTIVAPIITFDNRFIIDGHHRWSQLYMINPEAEITAINFDGPVTAGQVLRDMQGAIAATHGEVPQSFADVANVYDMDKDEIATHIYDNIVDTAVEDMWEKANLIELYPFNTEDDGEVPFEYKLDAVVDYLTDNALALKGNNAPYAGAAERKDMPQTDTESVETLDEGATDI